jgi:hypothetical protein
MKRALISGGAVAATLIAVAVLGAASASATVLCKTATNPCTSAYPLETSLTADLVGKSIFERTEVEQEITRCEKGTLGASTKTQGTGTPVLAPVTGLTLTECVGSPMTVLKPGTLEIRSIPGTHNGTVTWSGAELTFEWIGVDCLYAINNLDLGTLTGGTDQVLKVNLAFPRAPGPLCAAATRWTASFTFTTPSPLYVEPS